MDFFILFSKRVLKSPFRYATIFLDLILKMEINMKYNLYDKIQDLLERQRVLKGIVKFAKNDTSKQQEFAQYIAEYHEIEQQLDHIIQNCNISPMTVAEIISQKENRQYRLKIFRETENHNFKHYLTGNFIVCYLNDQNRFFNYQTNGTFASFTGNQNEQYSNYTLSQEQYEELITSLEETDSYVLATNKDSRFIPTLPPSMYVEGINFIKYFITGQPDNFINLQFLHRVKYDLIVYLQQINADEFFSKQEEIKEDIQP